MSMADEAKAESLARFMCQLDTKWTDPDAMCAVGEPLRVPGGFLVPSNPRPLWTMYLREAMDILDFLEGGNG